MTRVVAGLLRRDGRILIAQRRAQDRHPLKWEFPGGKVEPDETEQQALRRELNEELAIDAQIGEEADRYTFAYPGKEAIELAFFWVDVWHGEPVNHVFEQLAWAEPRELPVFDFLEGDRDLVIRLSQRPID